MISVDWKRWLLVIPARLGSERLPRKPLVDLGGLPLVVRVAKNLEPLQKLGAEVWVATDAEEVYNICKTHGVSVEMTSSEHPSGTDRCHEMALNSKREFVMNVQGDEPFLNIDDLKLLASRLQRETKPGMATLAVKSTDAGLFGDPSCVKVVFRANGEAVYFSRAQIPFHRDANAIEFFKHLGVYAFHRSTLDTFCNLSPGTWEQTEKLEQLRALENNIPIFIVKVENDFGGIDTQEDLKRARDILR